MVIKILGYTITYKPKDDYSRVLFHHTLFGRIIYRNYRGRKFAYYAPGILDNIEHFKIESSKVFLKTIDGIDMDIINIFGEIRVSETELPDDTKLYTAKEFWTDKAKEKGLELRPKRATRSEKWKNLSA